MRISTQPHPSLTTTWPPEGRHVLAQFDDTTVIVYQAYRPEIGLAAAADGRLGGGGFRFTRMSWVKPNFLWMMHRSEWATKSDQEITLALHIKRAFFDEMLATAVPSSFDSDLHTDEAAWQKDLERSEVRVQWDPDYDPAGEPVGRRAVQLGLRGRALRRLASDDLVGVTDLSDFVEKQRPIAESGAWDDLQVPNERVYPVTSESTRRRLKLDAWP